MGLVEVFLRTTGVIARYPAGGNPGDTLAVSFRISQLKVNLGMEANTGGTLVLSQKPMFLLFLLS